MNTPSKKLNRLTAGILTLAFLGFVFTAFFAMLVLNHHDLLRSVRLTKEVRDTLPAHAGPLDRLSARIDSFTATVSEDMWLKDGMGYVNSAFQYALGKRVINTGNQNMITLTTGHLYDLTAYKPLADKAREIAALTDTTLSGIPFLFTYEHPTLYDPAMMPAGYEALDHSARMADEALSTLRSAGVRVLDSREALTASGLPLNDLLMVTDQHWSTLAAITMARAIAVEVNDMTGAGLDPALLDPESLNTLVHERLFIGKYGQRLGPALVTPDDIVEYWPKADTHVVRESLLGKTQSRAEGSFRDAMTRFDRLEPEPGRTWNTYAYTYYGQVESHDIMANDAAPDFTLLLLKDSYSAPIGRFLSLVAGRVVSVDLRRSQHPLEWWVGQYRPDAVVMAYSMQMLRDETYQFQ